MKKTAWIFSYKLKENVKKDYFIEQTKKLHDEIISKQKGFISWEHFLDGEVWTDFVLWETEEDAKKATTAGQKNEITKKFYAYIDLKSCTALISQLVKKY